MMSDLGDVLELMQTSWQRWSTLRLADHEWRNSEAFNRAWEHHFDELRKTGTATLHSVAFHKVDGGDPPGENREYWRVWLAKPGKRRAEFQVGDEVVTAVFHGSSWWSWSPSRGFITNDGAPNDSHGFGPGEALIDPATHLASLELQKNERTTFLTRPAHVVTALPRQASQPGFNSTFHMLGTGADLYKLVVDAEVGVLLRVQAEFQGDAFRAIEVDDIGVNEGFGNTTFDSNLLRNGLTAL
jgi:outer membrane lipoprotein-sorting protein